jgi:uncharacterized protein (DUF3820 family)
MYNYPSPIMPFGKHRGQPVASLPTDYLHWLVCNVRFQNDRLGQAVRAELRRRGDETPPEDAMPGADRADLDALIKRWFAGLAMRYHPDRGGNHEAMVALNDAHDRLRELIGQAIGPPAS